MTMATAAKPQIRFEAVSLSRGTLQEILFQFSKSMANDAQVVGETLRNFASAQPTAFSCLALVLLS